MTSASRPFLVREHSEDIGEIRARADRLQRACSELTAELSELLDHTLKLAVSAPDDVPALLSVQACAVLMGLSRTTVFSLIHEGSLRSVKVGTRRLVPRVAIDEFVMASEDESDLAADRPAV